MCNNSENRFPNSTICQGEFKMTDLKSEKKTSGMSTSRKGKALLIALINLNVIFVLTTFFGSNAQISSQMITAILFLSGLYIGVQSGIDMAATYKGDFSHTDSTETKISKTYDYKMQYVDEKK